MINQQKKKFRNSVMTKSIKYYYLLKLSPIFRIIRECLFQNIPIPMKENIKPEMILLMRWPNYMLYYQNWKLQYW